MYNYSISQQYKPVVRFGIAVLSVFTAISCYLLATNDINSTFAGKIISITAMLALLSISMLSAAKHLTKGLPGYNLGLAGIIICLLAFLFFLLLILGEIESLGFVKFTASLAVAGAAIGYVCGIATIPGDSPEVKGLRLAAIACVSGLALLVIYAIFMMTDSLQDFGFDFLAGGGMMRRIVDFAKILQVLLYLSFGLTLITKLVSMIQYVPPPPAEDLLFDYELEQQKAEQVDAAD